MIGLIFHINVLISGALNMSGNVTLKVTQGENSEESPQSVRFIH